jgi:hypothetical protein
MRRLQQGVAAVVCGVALFAAGAALADNPNHTGQGNDTTTTSTVPSQAKAYGFYCRNESKTHVAGQKGTPFSQCVTAMAKVAKGESFKAACANLSHSHVAGQKGTPYSLCVSAAAKLKNDSA